MKFCPECGTLFEPNARFCVECGFDKSTVKLVEPATASSPGVFIHEIKTDPVIPIEIAEPQREMNVKCEKCGNFLEPGELYCKKCGRFASSHEVPVNETFKPVNQPEVIYRPTIPFNQPPDDKNISPIVAQPPKPAIIQPSEPPKLQPASHVQQEIRSQPASTPAKKKKSTLRIPLYIILIAVAGIAGWYGYNMLIATQEHKSPDTFSNMELPPVQDSEPSAPETGVTETPAEPAQEQSKDNSKPKSKVDQELVRQKTKEQNKAAPQVVAPAQKTNPDLMDKALEKSSVNEKQTKVIYEVGRNEEAKSKYPKNPTKLVLRKPSMIVRITTDHYNNGMGTKGGGTISIKDKNGNVVGTYRAYGKTGKNGTPDAKWVTEPHKLLQQGTYYISDSDMPTWSKSFWGTGFVIVEGYETE